LQHRNNPQSGLISRLAVLWLGSSGKLISLIQETSMRIKRFHDDYKEIENKTLLKHSPVSTGEYGGLSRAKQSS